MFFDLYYMFSYFLCSKGRPSGSESATYLVGPAGTGQPEVHYPKLDFSPICCFSFGSPIGLFLSARGMEVIGEDFTLPTCQKFFNIFHPVSGELLTRLTLVISTSLISNNPLSRRESLVPAYT